MQVDNVLLVNTVILQILIVLIVLLVNILMLVMFQQDLHGVNSHYVVIPITV